MTVLGFGDRPYTPAWPPDSPVRERFPSDVVAELKAAGWEPGRRSAADLPDAPDAVRAFVGEFGGLTVPTRGTGPLRRVGFTLDPEAVPDGEACDALAARIGRAVYPLGVMADDSHLLAIDSSARVFGLGRAHDVLLGHLPDEAVIKLVRGILTPAIGGRTGSYRAD
nr:SUKH-3 domain-containing protein [Actinomadura rayongensis]